MTQMPDCLYAPLGLLNRSFTNDRADFVYLQANEPHPGSSENHEPPGLHISGSPVSAFGHQLSPRLRFPVGLCGSRGRTVAQRPEHNYPHAGVHCFGEAGVLRLWKRLHHASIKGDSPKFSASIKENR